MCFRLFRLHSSWRAVSAVFGSLSNDDSSEIEKVLSTNYNARTIPSSDFRNDAVLSQPEAKAAALEQVSSSQICGTAHVVDHDRQTANSKIVEQSIESSNNITLPVPTTQVVIPMQSSEKSNHAQSNNKRESRMKEAEYGKDVEVACAADDIIVSSERQNNDSRQNTTQNNSPTIEIRRQLVPHETTAETALGTAFSNNNSD